MAPGKSRAFSNKRGDVQVSSEAPEWEKIEKEVGKIDLPRVGWPESLTVTYPDSLPEWGNLVRSTLMGRLPTKRMTISLEDISSRDAYISTLKQLFRKRLSTIPLNQETPLSTVFSLHVTNTSLTKPRTIYTSDFEWSVDSKILPKGWAGPFLPNLPFAQLQPNCSLHMKNISVRISREIDLDTACFNSVCTCTSYELDEKNPSRGTIVQFRTDGTAPPLDLLDRAERDIHDRIGAISIESGKVGPLGTTFIFEDEPGPQLAAYLSAEIISRYPNSPAPTFERQRVDQQGTFLRVPEGIPFAELLKQLSV